VFQDFPDLISISGGRIIHKKFVADSALFPGPIVSPHHSVQTGRTTLGQDKQGLTQQLSQQHCYSVSFCSRSLHQLTGINTNLVIENARQPSNRSSLLRKVSLPKGLPACVFKLSRPISNPTRPPPNSFRHWLAEIIPYRRGKSSQNPTLSPQSRGAPLHYSGRIFDFPSAIIPAIIPAKTLWILCSTS